jgi:hypothetical protein
MQRPAATFAVSALHMLACALHLQSVFTVVLPSKLNSKLRTEVHDVDGAV